MMKLRVWLTNLDSSTIPCGKEGQNGWPALALSVEASFCLDFCHTFYQEKV